MERSVPLPFVLLLMLTALTELHHRFHALSQNPFLMVDPQHLTPAALWHG